MPRKAAPKTLAELRAERQATFDSFQQHNAQQSAEHAARDAEYAAFKARVQARHLAREQAISAAIDAAEQRPAAEDYYAFRARVEREAIEAELVEQAGAIPRLEGIYRVDAEAKREALAEAERARLAALDPRQIWFSLQSPARQREILSWQGVNKGLTYPIPLAELEAAEASKPAPVSYEQALQAMTSRSRGSE